jgi:CheY-like chemotaxis protein
MVRVLLVEHLKTDRFIISGELSPRYSVTALASAEEAIDFAHTNPFDVALIDVMLRNDLDSIPLLSELQRLRKQSFLPLAMSSYVDDGRRSRLYQAGFVAVFDKPVDIDRFENVIRMHSGGVSGHNNTIFPPLAAFRQSLSATVSHIHSA